MIFLLLNCCNYQLVSKVNQKTKKPSGIQETLCESPFMALPLLMFSFHNDCMFE